MKTLAMIIVLFVFASCGGGGGGGGGTAATSNTDTASSAISFDLKNAVAIGKLSNASGDRSTRAATTGNLVAIAEDGTVTTAIENGTVSEISPLSGSSALVKLSDGSFYYVSTEGTQEKLDTIAAYKGQNSTGMLIFNDLKMYTPSTNVLSEFTSTLTSPEVSEISGNFVLLYDSATEVFQIADTNTSLRYNTVGSNITALSSTKALINTKGIIDMTNGNISTVNDMNTFNVNSGKFLVDDGALFISASCPGNDSTKYHVCHVSPEGVITSLITEDIESSSSSIVGSGDYFVVKESTQVWWGKRGVDQKNIILSGYNVTSVKMKGTVVYYVAEDNSGNPVTGMYDLDTSADVPVASDLGTIESIVPLE